MEFALSNISFVLFSPRLWTGIFVMNAPALIEPASPTNGKQTWWILIWRYRRVGLALLGPWFLWSLFDGEATGKLLPDGLEQTRNRYGYGRDEAYTQYVDTTPLIIPRIRFQ
jgi:hypothetical protein